jgi:metal-dependent amidase/aminoacylase/carboxypeptidase family protein
LGKAAHYTGAPWDGINALNAALLGLQAVNALRETFRDEDYIRFTPIITKGGESENIVPSQVEVSSYVKARTLDALTETDSRINKALVSGAQAIGAKVEISQFCNFMPLSPSIRLAEIFSNNASQFAQVMEEPVHRAWSTDMGDVSMIMPVLHPMIGGFTGGVHTKDFELKDKEMAYIIPAKIMAMTVVDLLYDNAGLGKQIAEEKKGKIAKDQYLSTLRMLGRIIEE